MAKAQAAGGGSLASLAVVAPLGAPPLEGEGHDHEGEEAAEELGAGLAFDHGERLEEEVK